MQRRQNLGKHDKTHRKVPIWLQEQRDLFLFITGRKEVTHRLRKKKKGIFLIVRKIRHWNELLREPPLVEALRNGSATALMGSASRTDIAAGPLSYFLIF